MANIHIDPTGLRLTSETTPDTFIEALFEMLGPEFMTPELVETLRERPLEAIAPLMKAYQPGDALWFCESEAIGPLHGHKGLALVRNGRPAVYMRILTF